jgi:Ca2+-binding RTX toxin-like protein
VLLGVPGNDTFTLEDGVDDMDGGPDGDQISFYWPPDQGGVIIDLAAGTAHGTEDERLVGFESFQGTNQADTLRGTDDPNVLQGGGGDDTIDPRGGNDYVFGGGGFDTADAGDGDDMRTDVDVPTSCEPLLTSGGRTR